MSNYTTYLTTQAGELATNAMRTAMLDGREHLVVPVVALVAGVVNGYLVTPAELQTFAAAWNGRPVPVRHPKDGNGYVSANDPRTIESQVVGAFFNARVDGGARLVGELWLDVAKCERLSGDALAVLQRLRRGEAVEVSTAYFCDVDPVAGEYNGKPYMAVQRNLRPDHIALLPDEVGACSWKDGCGAPRVNQAIESCQCKETSNMADEQKGTGVVPGTNSDEAPKAEKQAPVTPVANNEDTGAAPVQETSGKDTGEAPAQSAGSVEAGATKTDVLDAFRAFVDEVGADKVIDAMRGMLAGNAARRDTLVQALAANSAFSADELQRMSTDQLEKLDRSLRPANYGVRPASNTAQLPAGGFVLNGASYRPYVAPGADQKQ